MDGVSFLSSPTSSHDSAVENLLTEILDVAAIEQIQKLPSPYDSASSVLPSPIETRFQRLKSINQTTKTTKSPKKEEQEEQNQPREPPRSPPPPPNPSQPDTPQKASAGTELPAFNSPTKLPKSLPAKEFDHSWDSPSSSGSSSPPRKQGCCFWASPKKSLRKKGRSETYDNGGCGKDEEILTDLGTFSVRSQRERMKAALKEQEKMSKEAEKVIKWVRQASARISVNDLGDDLRRNK
ncbi:hypothetical protein EJ110_NYTH47557 [Nymphaea thermarum]|nr:hypothetical protein EJ110_NYTH47557 [Nymphaea thermarum]